MLLFLAFSFFQCQKDLSYVGEPDPIPVIPEAIKPEPITATLQGNILDENNQPAAGVSITVGTKTTNTNATGYFRIVSASLDKKSALVVAEKVGYFKGLRVFAATSGTNQMTIKLVKKTLAGTVGAASGGAVTLANGAKVSLPANGVVVAASGSAYTGDVRVYAAYINPLASDISQTVPGSFAANDKTGKRVSLSSYGMMAVELASNTGEKLQIKTGSAATLTTPIPPTVLASAPATISLWSVDETAGLWKEEGTATKIGNNYVGDVSHFSFWNCDQPINAVYLSMTIHTPDSLPLVYAIVKITRSGTGFQTSAYGYTDSLGQVSGLVPANESLLVEILDPCYNVAFTQTLAALTQNTYLGIITVAASSYLNTFKGKLLNCSGLPVINGYALISINNLVRYAAVDSVGNFDIKFITCASSATTAQVIAVDNATQQQSAVSTVMLTSPLTNVGSITACGTSSAQYINYTLDGTAYSLTSTANDSMTAYTAGQGGINTTYIMGNSNSSSNYINFSSPAGATGPFPIQQFSVQNFNNVTLIQPFNVTFTQFATTVGSFYEGSYSGSFTDSTITHTISTTFRVRRSF